jgi:hypothetical protein
MDIKWIKGSENNANAFTKNLDGPAFEKCIKTLVGQGVQMRKSPTSEQGGYQEESQGTQKGSQDFNKERSCIIQAYFIFLSRSSLKQI